MDFDSVLTGLDVGTAVAALIAAGGFIAALGFAKWATRSVATFFDGGASMTEAESSALEDEMVKDGFCRDCYSKPCQCR